jgi:hypothetical protein
LDDKIVFLEQQLRRVEQEKRTLQKKLTNRQQIRENLLDIESKEGRGKKKYASLKKQGNLRLAKLDELEKQKESLLTARSRLESIKLEYEQKLEALQSDLSKSKSHKDNLEKTFLARVKELENSLKKVRETAANPKINNDPDLSRKIDEACQDAIAEFWEDGNRKLQEHERKLKARHQEELLEERRLATLAVDKQRQKMRALARATAIREKELAAKLSRGKPKPNGTSRQKMKLKSPTDKTQDQMLDYEQLKAIRYEAERKAKEEEERMWLELERELQLERDRLNRMKQREEEEKLRCEQEEMERRRLLQQHALDMEDRLRREQLRAAAGDFGGRHGPSWFGRLLVSRDKTEGISAMSEPTIASIENYQRRVVWQPVSLPPKELVRITGPTKSD